LQFSAETALMRILLLWDSIPSILFIILRMMVIDNGTIAETERQRQTDREK